MTAKRDLQGAIGQFENGMRLVGSALMKLDAGETTTQPWRLPVGNDEHPSSGWYVYTRHDLTGRRNSHINNYAHTGIDLNGDWRNPETGEFRGNVDIGQPVFAVADGEIVSVGFSDRFRGGVVLKVDHFGVPLYVRYWHIGFPAGHNWFTVGETVEVGQQLGAIDEYPNGYAHLHFDMAWQPFKAHWWFTKHKEIEWANPVYILKTHCQPLEVDAMVEKSN